MKLEFKDVEKSYSRGTKVLQGINFTMKDNCVTGLLGLNGAGKTTLLKTASGILGADSGHILIDGKEIEDSQELAESVSFIPEIHDLQKNLTVLETLELALVNGNSDREQISRIIREFDLSLILEKKISVLSKGNAQRVNLALGLCTRKQFIILDEFSSGLDPNQTKNVKDLIGRYRQQKALVLSTHNISQAQELCDYIYIIHQGKIVASGTCEEIISSSGKKNLEDAFLFWTQKK